MLDLINTVTPDVMLCPETQHNVWQSAVTVLHFCALLFFCLLGVQASRALTTPLLHYVRTLAVPLIA